MHRLVLSGMLYKPVYTLPETIDRVAAGPRGQIDAAAPFPAKTQRRVCWFGYVESFEKGMASLVPVIRNALAANHISRFTLILDTLSFDNRWGFETIEYARTNFQTVVQEFDYAILSHFPLDLRVNSLIKSPNKAVTALFAGLIPLASRTPSYEALLTRLGLGQLLFASPRDLEALLSRLDPAADSQLVQASGVLAALDGMFGERLIAQQFLEHYAQFARSNAPAGTALPLGTAPTEAQLLYLSEHLRALGPAVLTAARNRLARLLPRRRGRPAPPKSTGF